MRKGRKEGQSETSGVEEGEKREILSEGEIGGLEGE